MRLPWLTPTLDALGGAVGPTWLIILLAMPAFVVAATTSKRFVFWPVLSWFLFAMRLPATYSAYVAPDEGQELAEAVSLLKSGRYWIDVDGHTHGPVVPAYLVGLVRAGLPLDPSGARVGVVIAILVCALAFWSILRSLDTTERQARVGVLIFVTILCGVVQADMVVFNAEYVGLALLFICVALLASRRPTPWKLFLVGFLGVMTLLAKVQFAPQVAVLFVASLWTHRRHVNRIIALAGGAIFFAFLLVASLTINDAFDHFIDCYLRANILYAAGGSLDDQSALRFVLHGLVENMGKVWTGIAILALVTSERKMPRIFCAALIVASAYAAYKPHRDFSHYLNLVCVVLAAVVAMVAAHSSTPRLILLLALAVVPLRARHETTAFWTTPSYAPRDVRVADLVKAHSEAADSIIVWGWAGHLYAAAMRAPGARHVHSEHILASTPQRRQLALDTWIADMNRTKPKIFVDAVAPRSFYFTNRAVDGWENVPGLAQLVSRHYTLLEDIDGVRVYERLD